MKISLIIAMLAGVSATSTWANEKVTGEKKQKTKKAVVNGSPDQQNQNFVACSEIEKPFVVKPQNLTKITLDPRQELIFDGGEKDLKILMIDSVGRKDRPRLTVMSGLQILEDGKMKSYPHRISVKLPKEEQGTTPRTIQIVFKSNETGKQALSVHVEYVQINEKKCYSAKVGRDEK